MFDIPVLFLVFNRLDTTKQVFEMIRRCAPQKLYLASDGPRTNRVGEKEKVEEVREYVLKSIDWNCELKTLFREENLGCGKAPAQAITWFFDNEEMGIILEDDCLPSLSFFSYCKELLEYYKDNEKIYYISGYNPLTYTKTPYSYYFSRVQFSWGWASWRRAWNHYSYDIRGYDDFVKNKTINKIFTRNADRYYWNYIFKIMVNHEIDDAWDYQWTYSIYTNDGVWISPAKNLITNIGFNTDGTHTIFDDPILNNIQRFEIGALVHPDKIYVDNSYMGKINKYAIHISTSGYYRILLINIIKNNKFMYTFLKKLINKARTMKAVYKKIVKCFIPNGIIAIYNGNMAIYNRKMAIYNKKMVDAWKIVK
jgi:hypothetical protein